MDLYNDTMTSTQFIDICETYFASLATLGISVLVASGDAGACNGNPACQSDPQFPVSYGNQIYQEESQCNSFVLSATKQGTTVPFQSCTVPMGYGMSRISGTPVYRTADTDKFPGAQCYQIEQICPTLVQYIQSQQGKEIKMGNKNDNDAYCTVSIDQLGYGSLVVLNTPCTCNEIKPMVMYESY